MTTPYQALLVRAREAVQPLTVHWELTWRCNLRCRHCYLPGDSPPPETSPAEASAILARLEELGCLYLVLSGGEPLLRPDFAALVEEAHGRGFALRLLTNGTLLDAPLADRLAELSLLGVEISMLGGDEATHDGLAGRAGAFREAWHAVELLRGRDLPVTLKCPVMTPNVASFGPLRQRAEDLGCKLLFDTTIAPTLDGDEGPMDLALDDEALLPFLASQTDALPEPVAPPPDALPCGAGQNAFALGPDGTVFPCVAVRVPLGHLLRDGWETIARHPFLLRWRSIRIGDLPACTGCEFLPWCARCPGLALQETGDPTAPGTAACKQARARARATRTRATRSGATCSSSPSCFPAPPEKKR